MTKLATILQTSWLAGSKAEVLEVIRGLRSPSFIEQVEEEIILGLYERGGSDEVIDFVNQLDAHCL